MAFFMDIHYKIAGLTAEGIADAHRRDLEVGPKHGARFLEYWFNAETGRAYCLFEAPTAEAGEDAHREAHGLLADEITEVRHGR